MGLLDDAIREHLELKLRHGADAREVAGQEQEALGPVRREPGPTASESRDPGAEEELEAPTELSPLPPGVDADEGADDSGEGAGLYNGEDDLEGERVIRGPGGSVPASAALDETEEWGFEDAEEDEPESARGDRGEDVLEQTPEFLSETPEHDRLWFEQKPPRDFDFDG